MHMMELALLFTIINCFCSFHLAKNEQERGKAETLKDHQWMSAKFILCMHFFN